MEGYKINIQMSVAFLYPNSKQLENVIQEKIFKTSKENNKSQLRHSKDDLKRYRDVSHSWVGKCIIIKTSTLVDLYIQCMSSQYFNRVCHKTC